MEKTITDKFIEMMWDIAQKDIPQTIMDESKLSILDYLGCSFLGAHMLKKENEQYLDAFGSISGVSSVIGIQRRTNAIVAAMLNGVNAHYIELDDGHRFAMLHPGAPVISALFAVAQDKSLNYEDVIRGIVVGYEATIRIARAIQPEHKLKGYHATGTCGCLGAAIGVITALKYPIECWNTVISAAATSAGGLLQVIDDGSELKEFNAGRAAASAVEAGYFGVTKLKGPADVLGGNRGFFKVLGGSIDMESLFSEDNDYAIKGIYRKPYASCRHSHAAIEAMLEVCKENHLTINDIDCVDVVTYDLAVKGHDQVDIYDVGTAKMSIPYAVAAAAKYGRVNYQEYEKSCLKDKDIKRLLMHVTVHSDAELSKLVPQKRAAIVRARSGEKEYEARVDYPLGEPENPIGKDGIVEKYRSLMAASEIQESVTEKIAEFVLDIENHYADLLEII